MRDEANVFIKIEEYKNVLDVVNIIRSKIDQAKEILARINDLKNQEDVEIEDWSTTLDDVERKVDILDKTLFEPEAL